MPALDLSGKTVVISGASAGIGAACARVFFEAGCHLALGARRMNRLEVLKADLMPRGEQDILIHPLDVADSDSTESFVRATENRFGRCDILINNAGFAVGLDPLLETSDENAQAMFNTNVMGVVRLTRAFTPGMVRRKSGHVVMLGSIAGRQFYEGGSIYCATKHALKAIAGSLRLELLGTGVRVTSIEPGMVETEFSEIRFHGDTARAKQVYTGMHPLIAMDIAEAILWSCTRPERVVIDDMLITPLAQGYTVKVDRNP